MKEAENRKLTELAHELIDTVEHAIRTANPEVDAIASRTEGNTLLYGENYYTTEDAIKRILRNRLK